MVSSKGLDLMKESVENRLLCCNVRKVQPLTKHLDGLDAWVTGLRRDQWATRTNIRKVEIDHDHGAIVKLNPLAEWTKREVWAYLGEHNVPVHGLLRPGLSSIGCEPCTRAIGEGEDDRAGRWWWETNAPKECGMHCSIEHGGSSTSHHEVCLVLLIGQLADQDLLPVVVVGTKPAIDAVAVEFDDVIGHGDDSGGGAVVHLQVDALCFVECFLKIEDVADIGLAPTVDRLIGVTDDEEILVFLCERFDENVLHPVGVLVLVDQDVLESFLIALQHAGLCIEELQRQNQQIVELDGVRLAQQPLVFGVRAGHDLVTEILRRVARILNAHHAGFVGADAAATLRGGNCFGS